MVALLQREVVRLDADTAPEPQRSKTFKEAVARLEYPPFSTESVKNYKGSMIESIAKKAKPWRVLLDVATLVFCISAPAVFFSAVAVIYFLVSGTINSSCWVLACSLATLTTSRAAYKSLYRKKVAYGQWLRFPMEGYDRPIPEFAQQTATDLKEEWPKVKLYIEELRVGERKLDPLLLAIDGNTVYYLEKWDEPDLKAVRQY